MNGRVNNLIESVIDIKGASDVHPLAKLFKDYNDNANKYENQVKSKWMNIVQEMYGISEKDFNKIEDLGKQWENLIFPTYAGFIQECKGKMMRPSHTAEVINYLCTDLKGGSNG